MKLNIDTLNSYELLTIKENKLYKVKELGIPSRTIFHWKEKNLLFEMPEKKEKNTMLTFSLCPFCC